MSAERHIDRSELADCPDAVLELIADGVYGLYLLRPHWLKRYLLVAGDETYVMERNGRLRPCPPQYTKLIIAACILDPDATAVRIMAGRRTGGT